MPERLKSVLNQIGVRLTETRSLRACWGGLWLVSGVDGIGATPHLGTILGGGKGGCRARPPGGAWGEHWKVPAFDTPKIAAFIYFSVFVRTLSLLGLSQVEQGLSG